MHEAMIKDRPGKYAVKVMFCRGEVELRKKQKESALQMSLSHENICVCKAAFIDESYQGGYKFVIVMEFSENGDLEEEIDKRKLRKTPWPEHELLGHMTQLVDAFAYLQESNLTHGDIKPRNLYLASDGKIKIGDFGESKQSLQALVTRTYQVAGTVIYFSPLLFSAYMDIIKGKSSNGNVRHNPIKSDVFSLGLSLLHMASLSKATELNNLDIGEDPLQQKIEKVVNSLKYSDNIKEILMLMLQVRENKRYDFKQLKGYLDPAVSKDSPTIEGRLARTLSIVKSPEIKLVSLSQTQGKAFLSDGSKKFINLSNNKFQSSSRIFLHKDSVIITGGLKSSTSVFKVNLLTSGTTKMNDMKEGRSWHCVVIFNNYVFAIGGRSDSKEPLASTEKLCIDSENLNSEE